MVCPIISLLGCFLCLAGDEITRTMEKGNQIHRIHIFQGEHDRQGEAFCHVEFCIVTEQPQSTCETISCLLLLLLLLLLLYFIISRNQ